MNNIEKLIDILYEQTRFNSDMLTKKLDDLISVSNAPLKYTEDVVNELNSILISEEKLEASDLEFLLNFSRLKSATKQYLLSNGLKGSEIKTLDQVKQKLLKTKEFYQSQTKNNIDISDLIRKLNGKKKRFITKEEIEYIIELIKDKFDIKNQIDVLKEINKLNFKALSNYNFSSNDTDVINEEDLNETNIDSKDIEDLLKKYGINYLDFTLEEKEKLSKYGNLDKMKEILDFLKNENIIDAEFKSSKTYTDIITRTLLFSSVEGLNEVKNANDIDFRELVRRIPTVLYPTTGTKMHSASKQPGSNFGSVNSGAMTNYLKNTSLLQTYNISFDVIWAKCYTFFQHSYKANRDSIDCLKSYGISLYDENNNLREIFSVLGNRNPSIIDIMDLALEADAKDYALKNPSSISPSQRFKFYLIKLARKAGLENTEIFGNYTTPQKEIYLKTKAILEAKRLSKDIDEIYKSYDAIDINIPNKNLYDNLFDYVSVNDISEEVLEDKNIKALDKFKESDDLYNFNGTKISRKKVLRYYTVLKKNKKDVDMSGIMYCIIYGSMLDENDFNNIDSLVKSVVSFEPNNDIRIIKKYVDSKDSSKKDDKGKKIGGSQDD